MVLRLAEHLEIQLRERNGLLLAAGYAPLYAESALDSPQLAAVQAALRQVLAAHEPYPAVVVDRHWNLVEANASVGVFTEVGAGAGMARERPPTAARGAEEGQSDPSEQRGSEGGEASGRLR